MDKRINRLSVCVFLTPMWCVCVCVGAHVVTAKIRHSHKIGVQIISNISFELNINPSVCQTKPKWIRACMAYIFPWSYSQNRHKQTNKHTHGMCLHLCANNTNCIGCIQLFSTHRFVLKIARRKFNLSFKTNCLFLSRKLFHSFLYSWKYDQNVNSTRHDLLIWCSVRFYCCKSRNFSFSCGGGVRFSFFLLSMTLHGQ